VVRRDLAWARQLITRPRLGLGVLAAAGFLAVNWVVYVSAVGSGRTTEASLGYFLNPIVTVALGVLVLGERLRPLQWLAVGIGLAAAVYLSIASGAVPLVALTLAFSFGGYGLVKKKVGVTLDALHSLAAETAVLLPLAIVVLTVTAARGTATLGQAGPVHAALLLLAGAVTAGPLLLFAAAARRIRLVTIGLLQFITPVLQLVLGVTVLGEHMPVSRWVGFAIVWVALAVLTVDMVLGRPGRARPDLEEGTP
jgi:chloramphenicol-sensitive protein RarD